MIRKLLATLGLTLGLLAVPALANYDEGPADAGTKICTLNFVYLNGRMGAKVYCTVGIWWQAVAGCARVGSNTVSFVVYGPKFYSSPSYALCPINTPVIRWGSYNAA